MAVIFVLMVAIGVKLFNPAVEELRQQEAERMGLEAELMREKQGKALIEEEISWIENEKDTGYVEALIKDRLDLKSPEESVIRMEGEPEPGDPTRERVTIIHDPEGVAPGQTRTDQGQTARGDD
jgi:hypothetical protein